MRKGFQFIILISLLIISGKQSFAQFSNLVFFSEGGERFYIMLNGTEQLTSPETNIQITHLPKTTYKVRIRFTDPKIHSLDKTLMIRQGTETTFCIRKNSRNEYVLRVMKQAALKDAAKNIPSVKFMERPDQGDVNKNKQK